MSDTLTIPVLPLRNLVVFPGVTTAIGAGRPGTLKAIRRAAAGDSLVFAVAQRQNTSELAPEGLYTIGTIARLDQVQRNPQGVQLLLTGEQRGIALRITEKDGSLEAVVREAEQMQPTDPHDPAFAALSRELRDRAAELGKMSGFPSEVVGEVLTATEDPDRLADLVATYLQVPHADRQVLLETLSVEERLRLVLVQTERQIHVLQAQRDIKSQVEQELGDRQREMVLREQLKAIERELGEEDDGEELEELRSRLEELELGPEARKEIDREFKRLGRMNRESMEYQVIRNYLETVGELPWNERSDDHIELAAAAEILEADHYGLQEVKDRVLELLAVRKLENQRRRDAAERDAAEPTADAVEATGDGASATDSGPAAPGNDDDKGSHAPILLFAGPPGVGKTSIAKSIARAMGRQYVRVSLGGARDEADIRGHRRTYVGAMPGRVLKGMKQAGTKNPVFLLDEVDKLGASYQGDPSSALLEVLDPAQNDTFVDHYLGIPFDLSEVLFIATANFLENIPGPLRDRMEVVDFSGYTEREKLEIAKRYLMPRQLERNALTADEFELTDDALSHVISHYTREAGVRQLEREIGKLSRKVARRVATGEVGGQKVGRDDVAALLGRPRLHPEHAFTEDQVGVATGMYYTPAGGDIMFVEVSTMRGKGDLVLTGQLGDVMKESARAAWSYARSHAGELGIDDEQFDREVHIHVPAGAIPKDGPSAGITMASALVSALSGRPVRADLAMTGEITLSGRVLPIGGVKEKVLGAVRAGIEQIVLPKDNVADLEDLSETVRDRIEVHAAESLSDVLEVALRAPSYRETPLPQKRSESEVDGYRSRVEN